MSEENRELLRRFYKAFNDHDLDILDELIAQDIVDHHPVPDQKQGLDGLKYSFIQFRESFSDMKVENLQVLVDGDFAMVRSRCRGTHDGERRGLPATGKKVDFDAIDNWRIEDGKLAEVWHIEDIAKLNRQLGL